MQDAAQPRLQWHGGQLRHATNATRARDRCSLAAFVVEIPNADIGLNPPYPIVEGDRPSPCSFADCRFTISMPTWRRSLPLARVGRTRDILQRPRRALAPPDSDELGFGHSVAPDVTVCGTLDRSRLRSHRPINGRLLAGRDTRSESGTGADSRGCSFKANPDRPSLGGPVQNGSSCLRQQARVDARWIDATPPASSGHEVSRFAMVGSPCPSGPPCVTSFLPAS